MMTRINLTLMAALVMGQFFTGQAAAQDASEIAAARKTVREAGERFLSLLEDLNEKQWNFKPAGSRHSLGEEAEHVALSENDLQHVIRQAMEGPENPELAKQLAGKEKKVRELMLAAENLAENYKPKNRLKTKPEVIEYFTRAHEYALKAIESTPNLSLHVLAHPHPDYSDLTAYQWYYYIAYHTLRHCKQIETIMADSDFPGGPRSPARAAK